MNPSPPRTTSEQGEEKKIVFNTTLYRAGAAFRKM